MSIGQSSNRISHLSLARHVAAALPKAAAPSDRLVAVLLASYAGPDGGGIRPSLGSLVDLSGLSRRSVLRCLANLKGWGLLVDDGEHRYGPGNMWVRVRAFDLNVVLEGHQGVPRASPVVTRVTPLDPLGGDSGDTTGGDSGDTQISLKGTPIESEQREVPLSISPSGTAMLTDLPNCRSPSGLTECDGSPPDFDWWYSFYPRHEGRGQAERAWKTAVKKAGGPEVLIRAIEAQLPGLRERDPRYIPLPATWLNGQRWLDEAPKSLDERMIDGWVNGASA